MSYAEPADLAAVCEVYAIPTPRDERAAWLLEQASLDVDRHLGVTGQPYDVDELDADAANALKTATALQAAFRIAQGELMLGADDAVAVAGPISFSMRQPPRFAAEAAERLAGWGLYARSGTVETADDAAPEA